MTTIIYKYVLGRYELAAINNTEGKDVRIILEEPSDGKLTLANRVFNVTRGVCKIPISEFPEGEISPKLITGGSIRSLEGFISSSGAVIRKAPDSDYIRSLARSVDALLKRLESAEKSLEQINKKINRNLEF